MRNRLRRRLFAAMMGGGAAAGPWYLAGGIAKANCILAYQPKGAASLAASYTNLVNPGTYNAAPGIAPGWDAVNGWKGDGSAWLDTSYIVPDASNFTIVVKFTNQAKAYENVCGADNGSVRISIIPWYTSDKLVAYVGDTLFSSVQQGMASGVVILTKTDCYRNGILDFSITAESYPNVKMAVMGRRYGGSGYNCINSYIQAFAIYDINFDAPTAAAINSALGGL